MPTALLCVCSMHHGGAHQDAYERTHDALAHGRANTVTNNLTNCKTDFHAHSISFSGTDRIDTLSSGNAHSRANECPDVDANRYSDGASKRDSNAHAFGSANSSAHIDTYDIASYVCPDRCTHCVANVWVCRC